VLVTLLVLWVVVVPALTLVGTYVLSGALARHRSARGEQPAVHIARSRPRRVPVRTRNHAAGRSRDHNLIQR
jgi:hypothetical protein